MLTHVELGWCRKRRKRWSELNGCLLYLSWTLGGKREQRNEAGRSKGLNASEKIIKNHPNHTSMFFFCPRKVSPLAPIQAFLELNQLGLLLVQICSPTQRYIRKVVQPQSESLRSHSTTGCIFNLNF